MIVEVPYSWTLGIVDTVPQRWVSLQLHWALHLAVGGFSVLSPFTSSNDQQRVWVNLAKQLRVRCASKAPKTRYTPSCLLCPSTELRPGSSGGATSRWVTLVIFTNVGHHFQLLVTSPLAQLHPPDIVLIFAFAPFKKFPLTPASLAVCQVMVIVASY